jgi:hypothetical protein
MFGISWSFEKNKLIQQVEKLKPLLSKNVRDNGYHLKSGKHEVKMTKSHWYMNIMMAFNNTRWHQDYVKWNAMLNIDFYTRTHDTRVLLNILKVEGTKQW